MACMPTMGLILMPSTTAMPRLHVRSLPTPRLRRIRRSPLLLHQPLPMPVTVEKPEQRPLNDEEKAKALKSSRTRTTARNGRPSSNSVYPNKDKLLASDISFNWSTSSSLMPCNSTFPSDPWPDFSDTRLNLALFQQLRRGPQIR